MQHQANPPIASPLDELLVKRPMPSLRVAAWPIMILITAVLTWANFAKLDEVSVALGKVVPLGKTKVVQHLEGGIVQEIYVSEGDTVSVGQDLLLLDLASGGTNREELQVRLDSELAARARLQAEAEEQTFYDGGAGDEWLKALEPIGTDANKPHLDIAPWLIVVFAQRWGQFDDGARFKNYYVPESVGIATGFLLTALHTAGLVTLTHTPNPMKFLTEALGRPDSEKPVMIIAVGHPAEDATVPAVAKLKKPLGEILSVFE